MPRRLFDPYSLLGLPRTATSAEIANAYRRHVRDLHPDTRTARDAAADERLQRVLAAYKLLRDPERRARYDRAAARYERAARRRPTVQRAQAKSTTPAKWSGSVRILGVNLGFRAGPLSE
jgi:curved DNA-binding protein CbpA